MKKLSPSADLKLDLLFEGLRYSPALGAAAGHSQHNFYPYRFGPGEVDPSGAGSVPIPYLLDLADDTLVRIKGNGASEYWIDEGPGDGYVLRKGEDLVQGGIRFEPQREWMKGRCSDGTPMGAAGVSVHGDMLVVNPAPGCQYFQEKRDGKSLRCVFCLYGRPDDRTASLGQRMDDPLLPPEAIRRIQETVGAALAEGGIQHVYLVAGSMIDWQDEARRYIQLAEALRAACPGIPYLACGSGALPDDALRYLRQDDLVDGVCFNLEVWGEELFQRICPGKAHSVGFRPWLRSLERAVDLWGPGHVYSAMVAGVELEPEYGGLSVEGAADLALAGAAEMTRRGILPIYSLYWPMGGKDYRRKVAQLRDYFERVSIEYADLRRRERLFFHHGFMCHRCSYMQLECDLDRAHHALP